MTPLKELEALLERVEEETTNLWVKAAREMLAGSESVESTRFAKAAEEIASALSVRIDAERDRDDEYPF